MRTLDPLHDPPAFKQGWYAYVKTVSADSGGLCPAYDPAADGLGIVCAFDRLRECRKSAAGPERKTGCMSWG